MATVLNPPIPYTSFFALGPARAGTVVQFRGFVPHGSDGFTVNFKTGEGDIALHFNIRFNEGQIVMNALRRGKWGGEQRVGADVLGHGQHFELIFLCQHDQIGVAVNGQPFTTFTHRVPKEEINQVEVVGDVTLTLAREANSLSPGEPTFNPPVPLIAHIPGGMTPGRKVIVNGLMVGAGFAINLNVGNTEYENTAIHFNPRSEQGTIVLNHTTGSNWHHEERTSSCPIEPGQTFLAEIECEPDFYRIIVNGEEVAQFAHRDLGAHPLESIDHIHIGGDVEVHQVMVQ